ncbi:MAG: MFS transporter, partial [Chloroflexi bacterium]|nr:MFS transporter [Chloroflexota bacterium]
NSSWWVLIVAAILQGSIMSLMMPSRQAMVREIVTGEQLMNAIALNNLGMNIFRLVAPALAGFLIDFFDFKAVYFTMAGLYLLATIFNAFLPRTSKITANPASPLADIKDGVKYIRYETTILLLILFSLFTILLSMPYMTLMPIGY